MTDVIARNDHAMELGARREAVRAFMNELMDEFIAVGDLRRIVLSVRRSVAEGERSALCPGGFQGALADELAGQLLGEVEMELWPARECDPQEPETDGGRDAERAFFGAEEKT